jgi:HPt (histidine-containing phosphotransfer) domain-containing protein
MSSEDSLHLSITTDDNSVASPLDQTMLKQLDKIMGREMTLILIQQLLSTIPQQLATLQQLYTVGNMKALCEQAHQLKGECWQVGAVPLGVWCEQLEVLARQRQVEAIAAILVKMETEWMRVKVALSQVNNNG